MLYTRFFINDQMTSIHSIHSSSKKITKTSANIPVKRFICGACSRCYGSYSALYIHAQRKHNGLMPENSIIPKQIRPDLEDIAPNGRPTKVIYCMNTQDNNSRKGKMLINLVTRMQN